MWPLYAQIFFIHCVAQSYRMARLANVSCCVICGNGLSHVLLRLKILTDMSPI